MQNVVSFINPLTGFKPLNTMQVKSINRRFAGMNTQELEQAKTRITDLNRHNSVEYRNPSKANSGRIRATKEDFRITNNLSNKDPDYNRIYNTSSHVNITDSILGRLNNKSINANTNIASNSTASNVQPSNNFPILPAAGIATGALGLGLGGKYLWDKNQNNTN